MGVPYMSESACYSARDSVGRFVFLREGADPLSSLGASLSPGLSMFLPL